MKKYILLTSLFTVLLGQNACRNDYVNPSAALDTQAVSSPDALAALVNGLAYRFTIGRLGTLYNAVAAGGLTTREMPVQTGKSAPFVPRVQVLTQIVQQLEAAATTVAATPVSAAFTARMAPGMDVPNTIQALIARYSLMAGDYDKALAAAGRVNLTARSVFSFDDNTRNPVFETAFSNVNVFAPQNATLGLPADIAPDPNDRRLAFYLRSNPTPQQNLGTGFYTSAGQPVPVYLPGEMLLIRAEAFARKNDLTNAVTELNRVLTKTPAQDVFGVGAGLPAYAGPQTQAAILTEIYRNRQIELAFQGFRLEDSRRFGRSGPGTAATFERNRNFLPYPLTESDNNPSTPTTPVG